MRSQLPPRFSEDIHEKDFEELCRDLLQVEPNIRHAEIYGINGQAQKGVDILAYRTANCGIELGECKCRDKFGIPLLTDIVSKFLENWDHWKTLNSKRFIVFAGCPVRDTKIQDLIAAYVQEFGDQGLVFEIWDSYKIADKLRNQRAIAERYCGSEWARLNCTSTANVTGQSKILQSTSDLTQLISTTTATAEEIRNNFDNDLERIREIARIGKKREAFDQCEQWRTSTFWNYLDPQAQAKGLALAAGMHLDHLGKLEPAKTLLKQAEDLFPSGNYQVIQAAICDLEKGPKEALKTLGEPKDLRGFNFQMALLIKSGKSKEALQYFNSCPWTTNGQTFKQASLAALICGDIEKAKTYSFEALKRSPEWFDVRFHAAKVNYLQTVLPSFRAWLHLDFPIPPDPEFHKRDSESTELLQNAEKILAELLTIIGPEDNQRTSLEAWRLACLASLPNRRQEAEIFAKYLLQSDTIHTPALIWSMHHGFSIDAEQMIALLNMDKLESADLIQALSNLYLQTNAIGKAKDLLDSKRYVFERDNNLYVWRLVRAQLASFQGNFAEADQIAAEEEVKKYNAVIRLSIARIRARKSRDFRNLAETAMEIYKTTKSPEHLFEACEASLECRQPQFASDHAEELLKFFSTATCLSLVVQATFNAGSYKKCLDFIETNIGLFSEGIIPNPIRRMQIECLRQLGKLPEALQLADGLVHDSNETENLIVLLETQLSVVDFKAASMTARRILDRDDVPSLSLLQIAGIIQPEDAPLAIEFWQKALRKGLTRDVELANAVDLAFRLGMEKAVAPLMPGFYAMASKPNAPIKAFSLDQIRTLLKKNSKQIGDINTLYNQCRLPSHLAADKIGCTLADLFHENARSAREQQDLWRRPPVQIRHAARVLDSSPSIEAGTLFADLSAILFAQDQGLLDIIEKSFAPIFISAHLPESLNGQITRSMPHQPASEETRKIVLDHLSRGELSTTPLSLEVSPVSADYLQSMGERWCHLVSFAENQMGILCDFVPSMDSSGHLVSLDGVCSKLIATTEDILRWMLEERVISATEADQARHIVAAVPWNTTLSRKDVKLLILNSGIACQFAKMGLLSHLCRFVPVQICSQDIESIREESVVYERRLASVSWLRTLADRIQRGIQRKIYLPVSKTEKTLSPRKPQTPEEFAIFDLLSCKEFGAKVGWADDRFINRYENLNGISNYGISEILKALKFSGQLNEHEYYHALHHLRSSNARFLPIEADEIFYHILRVPVADQVLTESEALTTLRSYVASCCLDKWRLRPPTTVKGQVVAGEFTWVFNILKATAESMARLWTAESLSEAEREIRAEWLADRLFIPVHGVIEAVAEGRQLDGGAGSIASLIAMLISSGFMLPSPFRISDNRDHARARYYDWIDRKFLQPMKPIEPSILKLAAELELEGLLKDRKAKTRISKQQKILQLIVLRAWLDLPASLRKAITLSPQQRRRLGLKESRKILGIFNKKFDSALFWKTIEQTLKKGTASVSNLEGDSTYTFSKPKMRKWMIRIPVEGPNLRKSISFVEPASLLLSGGKREQRAFLRQRIDWFDMSEELTQEAINKIVNTSAAGKRMERLDYCRDSSAEYFYRSLEQRLKKHERLNIDDCTPPEPAPLLHHLRMLDEHSQNIQTRFDQCASRLLREIGLAWTIERFACLPVLLPQSIRETVRSLESLSFQSLLKRLQRRLRSPLPRLHLLHLMLNRPSLHEESLLSAKTLLNQLVYDDQTKDQWKTFSIILDSSLRQFLRLDSYRELDPISLLTISWIHSTRLHNSLLIANTNGKRIRATFKNYQISRGLDMSSAHSAIYNDAANPRFAGRLPVLLRGLASIFDTLPHELSKQLKLQDFPGVSQDGLEESVIMFLRDTALMSNSLNSFMGGDAYAPLTRVLDLKSLTSFIPQPPHDLIQQCIDTLHSNPSNLHEWHVLSAVIGDLPIPRAQRQRLENIIVQTNFSKLLIGKDEDDQFILHFAALRTLSGLKKHTLKALEKHVWNMAQFLFSGSCTNEVLNRGVILIMACFYALSVVPGDEKQTCFNFHRKIAEFIRQWPESALILRNRYVTWPSNLPLSRQQGIWDLELTLRAIP